MTVAPKLTGRNPFYDGCTATELARIFDVPVATVRDNMVRVVPCGKRGNVDLYQIREAAMALRPTELDDEMVRNILKMNHSQLPVQLSKEFWAAEIARQRFMEKDGELWPTAKVVEWLGDAYKQIRLSLMLLADSVNREDMLTERQRELLQRMIDGTLNSAADTLRDVFANRRDDTSHAALAREENDDEQEL